MYQSACITCPDPVRTHAEWHTLLVHTLTAEHMKTCVSIGRAGDRDAYHAMVGGAFGHRGRHASLPSRDGKRARAPRRATSFPWPHPPVLHPPPFFPGGPRPDGPAQRAHATGASSATSPPTTRGAHRTRDAPRPRGAAWRAPRPRRAPPLRFTRRPCARRQAATGEGGAGRLAMPATRARAQRRARATTDVRHTHLPWSYGCGRVGKTLSRMLWNAGSQD